MNGEIRADRVVINGEFEGTCYANVIEILSHGRVSGAIYSDNLSIEQGGKFYGATYAGKTESSTFSALEKPETGAKKELASAPKDVAPTGKGVVSEPNGAVGKK